MADSFLVSSEFAGELQETVIAVKSIVGDGDTANKLPVDHTEGISVPKTSSQHVASFSGAWAKGTIKGVTILSYASGSFTATSETVSAHNLFFEITSTSGKCFVAKESSSSQYILVAAECD